MTDRRNRSSAIGPERPLKSHVSWQQQMPSNELRELAGRREQPVDEAYFGVELSRRGPWSGLGEPYGKPFSRARAAGVREDSLGRQTDRFLGGVDGGDDRPGQGRVVGEQRRDRPRRHLRPESVPPCRQVGGESQADEPVARVEQEQRAELIGRRRLPRVRAHSGRWQQPFTSETSLIPMNAPMQLDRWKLRSRVNEREVQSRKSARVDVVGGLAISESSNDPHGIREMLDADEHIDVSGAASPGFAVDRFAETRTLEHGARDALL